MRPPFRRQMTPVTTGLLTSVEPEWRSSALASSGISSNRTKYYEHHLSSASGERADGNLEWKRLTDYMRREFIHIGRVKEIELSPKYLFKSSLCNKEKAREIYDQGEKLIAERAFQLPAQQILIEDPSRGVASGRRFYLCTQSAEEIEIWRARQVPNGFVVTGRQKSISLSPGAGLNDDEILATSAVREFVLALNAPLAAQIAKTDCIQVGWVRGRIPNTKPSDFGGFVEALRQREVLILDPGVVTGEISSKRFTETNPNRWSVPVYDFGTLLHPPGDGALDGEILDALLDNAPEVRLPASSCAFLFREKMDSVRGWATWLVLVDGSQNGKPNVTFTAAHAERHLRHHDMTVHSGYWSILVSPDETAEATKLVEIACRLLSGWRDSLEVREAQDGRVARVNTRRTAANQMPIQQTQTIHITEQRVVCLREQLRPRLRSATGKAMPQHKRTITDRWIHPKNPSARMFRPYQRRPQEIIVNKDRPPAASRFRVVK